jgi:3'-5' exoribonuclease
MPCDSWKIRKFNPVKIKIMISSGNEEYEYPQDDGEKRLADLTPGRGFRNATFAFSDAQLRQAKTGKNFLVIKLRDRTGAKQARWFSPDDDILDQLQNAKLICVSGSVDGNPGQYYGEIRLDSCAAAPTPDDLSPYVQPLPGNHGMHRARFFELIRSVQNNYCKELLKAVFDLDGKNWQTFEAAPAAKSMHHGYRGGLLEHTGEVAALCDSVASTLPYLDRDLLITAALLHDFGKLEELAQDLNSGEYTQRGHLIGHVVLGTCTVREAMNGIEDFPETLKDEILHLILSHHGRAEFGAARNPMFPEAIVLSMCDMMSARVAQCRELLESQESGDFNDIFGWDTRPVYLGTMKRMMADSAE